MRLRTRTWMMISVACFVAAGFFWHLGERRAGRPGFGAEKEPVAEDALRALNPAGSRVSLLSTAPHRVVRHLAAESLPPPAERRTAYRLQNTVQSLGELARNDRAILLNNALLDTGFATDLEVPEHLRPREAPVSYIIQARNRITPAFRNLIRQAGGAIVSYIPNNAFLVEMTPEAADRLEADARVQSVIGWQPYFKLSSELLGPAVDASSLSEGQRLQLVLFPRTAEATREAVEDLGAEVVSESPTPFGPLVVVDPPREALVELAQLPGVQGIEKYRRRFVLNDRARQRTGVAQDLVTETNYLNLTGRDIPVNVNDTGVEAVHPDLAERVFPGDPIDTSTLIDNNGHGTHVAGTIASSGENSPGSTNGVAATNVVDIPGSPTNPDFRGMAPEAEIYVLPIDLVTGPLISDAYLQKRAAQRNYIDKRRENPMVSNNSWGYIGAFEYNISAANYDAAVRDALPEEEGSQPLIYVFAAGNSGAGGTNGLGGEAGSISSPATAKNVISVGAIESFREITNEVVVELEDGTTETNAPFLGETDSNDQVAAFSSRGNVGIGVEGINGRFKPDVVAPGTFVISTRSSEWEDPEAFTDFDLNFLPNQELSPGQRALYQLRLPPDTSQARIDLFTNEFTLDPENFQMPIRAGYNVPPGANDPVVAFNSLVIPGDLPLQKPADLYYSIRNDLEENTGFDIRTLIIRTNANEEEFKLLQELNDDLKPHYRYESGTSMAAPVVTGTIALMQEYFERQGLAYSPALIKALLINGARNVNRIYSLAMERTINYQGWGGIYITNSLPASPFDDASAGAVKFIDQDPDLALATGESRSWNLQLDEDARNAGMRITLVWTDPPANPNAGIKLVNDLDLVVRNEDTDQVYVGNNIPLDSDFTAPLNQDVQSTNDFVNNVENVFLREAGGTNWTVTVKANRVNVNAVPRHPDNIVQDFALVIATADVTLTNAVTVTVADPDPIVEADFSPVVITNGVPLLNQHVGANSPLLGGDTGVSNQWNFYVFTNTFISNADVPNLLTNGTNVAFATFVPPDLSEPSRTRSGDLDLYVTRGDPGLLTLDPFSVANAFASTNAGGTELVFFTDAAEDEIFYIGVKSEDQRAVEFGIVGLSTDIPFEDRNGDILSVNGLPPRVPVPDGSAGLATPAFQFGVGVTPALINHLTIDNGIDHPRMGDLVGLLSHNEEFAVLHNHTSFGPQVTNVFITYDDTNTGQTPGDNVRPSDGPGSLVNFLGEPHNGLWVFSVVDNALQESGATYGLQINTTPIIDLSEEGVRGTVLPNRFTYYVVDVPIDAVEMRVIISDITDPLDLFVRRGALPTQSAFDKTARISPPGGQLVLSERDDPPLNPGRYFIGVFNPNNVSVDFTIKVEFDFRIGEEGVSKFFADEEVALTDDAVTYSSIFVPTDLRISDLRAGVRIDHPRASDLALRLLSPQGSRVLLFENRGGDSADSLGISKGGTNHSYAVFTINTNLTRQEIKFADPPFHVPPAELDVTNRILLEDGFESVKLKDPDSAINIYTNGEAMGEWDVGLTAVQLNTDPSEAYEGSNYVTLGVDAIARRRVSGSIVRSFNTVIGNEYRVSFAHRGSIQVLTNRVLSAFIPNPSGDWEVASVPVRALGRETSFELRSLTSAFADTDATKIEEVAVLPDIYYLPEEGTKQWYTGERGAGTWRLEIFDDRAGPEESGPPALLNWKLEIDFANPTVGAVLLRPGEVYHGTLIDNEPAFFKVLVPRSATTATNIAFSFGDIVMAGDRRGLPNMNPLQDEYYVDNFGSGAGEILIISTNDPPTAPLQPGQIYYLGLQNFTGLGTNDFDIAVFFDRVDEFDETIVPELTSGVTETSQVPPGLDMDFWRFTVSSNAVEALVELEPLDGDVDLYIRRARGGGELNPLPATDRFDYLSANPGALVEEVTIGLDPTVYSEPLAPGTWYIGVLNNENSPVNYNLTWTETTADVIRLEEAVPYANTNSVFESYDYYVYRVPPRAIETTFEVINATGELLMVLRSDPPLPVGGNDDYRNTDAGNQNKSIIVTDTSEPVSLRPGDWYLGVFNNDAAATPIAYEVVASSRLAEVTTLENEVTVTNIISWTNRFSTPIDYYRFPVSPLAERAVFELFDMQGNYDLDLFASYTLTNGLPTPFRFDYASTNAIGIDETIQVVTNQLPVPLQPGDWYLSVVHRGTNTVGNTGVEYSIRATEFLSAPIFTLTNNVPQSHTNSLLSQWNYFQFDVSTNALEVEFEITDSTGDLDMYARRVTVPTEKAFDAESATPGMGDELIRINPESPVPLEPGLWYIGVINRENRPVTYTITARESIDQGEITRLQNAVPLTVVNDRPGRNPDHFVFNVSTNAIELTLEVFNATNNVTLYLRESLPLPDDSNFDYRSDNPSLDDELIVVGTNSVPVAVSPGDWWITVLKEVAGSAQYTIRATETLAQPPGEGEPINPDLVLTPNQICLQWDSEPGRFYRVEGRVRIDDPTWNVMLDNFQAVADRSEVCFDRATTPERFFQIIPLGEEPPPQERVTFDPKRITVDEQEICLTWDSEAGKTYFVEGKIDLFDPDEEWTVLAEVVATGAETTHCLDLATTPQRWFQIATGEAPPPQERVTFDPKRITVDEQEICLTWDSEAGKTYFVEGKIDLFDPDEEWTVLAEVVATGAETTHCLDLATTPQRWFQIATGEAPPEPPQERVTFDPKRITVDINGICLTWDSEAGKTYFVEGKIDLSDPDEEWMVLAEVVASGAETTHCLDLAATPQQWFRIATFDGAAPGPGPGEEPFPVAGVRLSIEGNDVVLRWPSEVGETFTILGRRTLGDPEWDVLVQGVVSGGQETTYRIAMPTPYRFFQVMNEAGQPPEPTPPQPSDSLDPQFQSLQAAANRTIIRAFPQSEDGILLTGNFIELNGLARTNIARINPEGTLDTGFQAGSFEVESGAYAINALGQQSDGKLIVGGRFASIDGTPVRCLARLQPDGALDPTFDIGIGFLQRLANSGEIYALAIQPDDKILVGGFFTRFDRQQLQNLVRLNPDGSLDASFNHQAAEDGVVRSIRVLEDGRILIGGEFTVVDGTPRAGIARLTADGSLDASFNPGPGAERTAIPADNSLLVTDIAVQPDGKVLVVGRFERFSDIPRPGIARLNEDGSLDPEFDPGSGIGMQQAAETPYRIRIQSDGNILVGGQFADVQGEAYNYLARFLPDGTLDPDFQPPAMDPATRIRDLLILEDGSLVATGFRLLDDGAATVQAVKFSPAP